MQLVEQHVISKHDPRYRVIDETACKSKNLYNAALYEVLAFIHEGNCLSNNQLDKLMQSHEAYRALPAKVSQQILMVLVRNWKSFKEARKAYEEDPSKFTGRPKLPKYKHKTEGRNILVYTIQAIASNREGFVPRLVNGRPIKAWNQWYNKRMKELKKRLPKEERERVTRQMERITNTRNRQINHYLHTASKASFLDLDPIPTYTPNDEEEHIFSGKRIGRRNRLYRAKDGRTICADVNGAYNIVRKRRPDAFSEAKGVAGYVVHPVRLAV